MNIKINFLKKKNNWQKGKESFWMDINFYWKCSVCFMFVVIVFSFFFGYYLFMQVKKEFVPTVEGGDKLREAVRQDRVEKALQYFREREENSKKIQSSPVPIIDPSL